MPAVVLVDTSVFLNVLDVPAFNQHRTQMLQQFGEFVRDRAHLLLPVAAVFEAGNHIAQLNDGRVRRECAERFAHMVRDAIDGSAPWGPIRPPTLEEIGAWLNEFPNHAMRGIGMGDMSIIEEWKSARVRHPRLRVLIWSLDAELAAYGPID
jgi:hypothetical protein